MSTPMKRTTVVDGEWVSLPLIYNSGGTEVSTGFVLPTSSIIYPWEMFVLVDTVDSTETVSIGILSTETGGDADGFLALLSVATQGIIKPVVTCTQGTNANYISATTYGILFLAAANLGANTSGHGAIPYLTPYICNGTAKTISYTPSSSDTFVGRLIFRVHMTPLVA